ncbi:MAG TPA: cytochrome b N-terminal domain-containing protein [Candidatus Nanopelagicales bacterium]|nr:cytochrome b N-terminal domain-containing protein [Candidatus Nanopelagicales bacterium]
MGLLRRVGGWFYDRLQLSAIVDLFTHHKVPPGVSSGKSAWMYVLGFATLSALLIQVGTGVALVTKYIPSADGAYESIQYLTYQTSWGRIVRAMHYYGASAMVLFVFLHMIRVFLTGSFKFPREMSWISGVFLLVLVMAMAYTGQLLRWDENGIWTVVVGSKFAGRTPWIGRELSELILAGETIGGHTLSRFFALHVFIFPLGIGMIVALHLYLVFRNGVSEPPKAGRLVDPKTYRKWYDELAEKHGAAYFPWGMWREVVFASLVIGAVVALALVFGPKGPGGPPDPTDLTVNPQPDWFLRWYYALIWVKPRWLEEIVMVWAPIVVPILLLLIPIVAGRGERHPARRPWAILAVGAAVIGFVTLLVLGYRAPWVPAVESEPLPPELVGVTSGPALEGAALFHERGCQLCHTVLGRGGNYGPDLTHVAMRLSPEEITARTLNGIRDMPAYRNILEVNEISAIVAFLQVIDGRKAEGDPR